MVQIVTMNGRPHDLDYKPALKVNTQQDRTPIKINGRMVHGVNINGFEYPPAEANSILYYPGLPGYGTKLWDRSNGGNDGTIMGATWKRLPSGLWITESDGSDDKIIANNVSIGSAPQYFSIVFWLKILAFNDRICFDTNCANYISFYISNSDYSGALISLVGAGYKDIRPNWGMKQVWKLYTMTFDNGIVKQYKNGGLVKTDDYTGDSVSATWNISLHARATAYYSQTQIGRSRVLSGKVLTSGEIGNIYNCERHLFGV